jgi:23S rRNA (cytidine1920-2'-O)/16S rRNA (cytidine1409-2'-O)-methyltransferase
MAKRQRIDQALVQRGLCDSREQARRLILAGEVLMNGHTARKASDPVTEATELTVKTPPKYVGRGGLKLEAALERFGIDPAGRVGLDIGASTGGFTDCLLQSGAARVHAFDVGTNQLVWKIRSDPRVHAREQFNCRHLSAADVGEPVSLVVMDVSFISLTLILPVLMDPALAAPGCDLVMLVKPQFEVAREQVGRGGIVRDDQARLHALTKIQTFVADQMPGWSWVDSFDCPVAGTDGNREFLAWCRRQT